MAFYLNIILGGVLVILGLHSCNQAEEIARQKASITSQQKAITTLTEERNAYVLETTKQKKKLEEAAGKDAFDWYADISNSDVVKQLRKD